MGLKALLIGFVLLILTISTVSAQTWILTSDSYSTQDRIYYMYEEGFMPANPGCNAMPVPQPPNYITWIATNSTGEYFQGQWNFTLTIQVVSIIF